ncbi:hypothetical protein C9E81_22050 [Paracoccus alkanivorans]|uniref:Uncharacterized protein n=2 Tax=Paracoccus alkanivorans TaxID=2116655 RepID=A0A3M0LXE2_9RHOB|nr:hypothetical protein C9E81_22050 [Paracoccus alkanivorans]
MMSVPFQIVGPVAGAEADQSDSDPALALWREWQAAHHQTDALCRQQQRLEAMLMRMIDFPSVEIDLDDDGTTVSLSREEDIEDLLGNDPILGDLCAKAKSELMARQTRWAEADALIGFSAARQEELAAADHAQQLVDALTTTPATTLAGVAAKFDMILREGQSSEDCDEFPWRELRLTLSDLVQIGQSLQPDSFMSDPD